MDHLKQSEWLITPFALLLGVFVSLIFGLIGIALTGDGWMQYNAFAGGYFTIQSNSEQLGIFLVFLCISIGPTFLGYGLLSLKTVAPSYNWVYLVAVGSIAIGIIVAVIVTGVTLIDAFSPYTWYNGPEPMINTLTQLLGGILVSVYTPIGLCVFYLWGEALMRSLKTEAIVVESKGAELQPKVFSKHNFNSLMQITVAIMFIFILTLFLPNIWIITNPNLEFNQCAASAYFTYDSPYSLVQNVPLYSAGLTQYSWQNVSVEVSVDGFTFNETVEEYLPTPYYLQPIIYVKLYTDVVVYYSFIAVIIAVGITGTYYTPLRRFLHRRIPVDFIPEKVSLWPLGASLGELLLAATILALYCFWVWYWGVGWGYRKVTMLPGELYFNTRVCAQVMGELTILTISFLTFPITHNSVWESVFGVPIDRAIKYHRALGVLTWIFATLHMMIWQATWIAQGTLANNAWLTTDNLIVAGTMEMPSMVHATNFTIPIMEFMWLLCTLVLSAALLRQTYRYELFVYTHYLMLLFFALSFLHAFQSWFYCGAGLLLYVFDKCLRLINSSRVRYIKSIEYYPTAKITRLRLHGHVFGEGGFAAGLFCWIHIPAVSPFEWHPFSLSSPPCLAYGDDGVVEFSILNMGEGTWTGNLAALASTVGPTADAPDRKLQINEIQINLDGPFGRAIDYSMRHTVVLVAGGIGVTPMISIMAEIAARKKDAAAGPIGVVATVHFIWVVRESDICVPFLHILDPIALHGEAMGIHLHIHATASKKKVDAPQVAVSSLRSSNVEMATRAISGDNPLRTSPNRSVSQELHSLSPMHMNDCTFKPDSAVTATASPAVQPSGTARAEELGSSPTMRRIASGRPNLDQLFSLIAASAQPCPNTDSLLPRDGNLDVACIVCGPPPLVKDVSNMSYKYHFDFQSEEFVM